jgi:hypothetical protein
MGIPPPVDLNLHINHEPILQSLQLPVKQHLPSTTTCPFCQQQGLDIYLVPSGGRWYICRSCGFRGDSVEFYCKAHAIPTVYDAVMDLSANKILPISKHELQIQTISTYVTAYVARRHQINDLFAEAQGNLDRLKSQWIEILQELHLWDGYRANIWRKEIGQYIGAMQGAKLKELGVPVPPRGFAHCILCPYYEVPGKISSMLLLARRGRTKRVSTASVGADVEDGLMMMGTTRPMNDVVIALNDPVLALQLQRKKINISKGPLPIVVYDENTRKAWDAVHARRIIHWQQTASGIMFQQAMRHTRAFVASRPRFNPERRDQYIAEHSIAELLDLFNKSAQTWAEAFKTFLLDSEYWQATELLSVLDLQADKLQKIYEVCDPHELTRIKQLIGESGYERFVTVGNLKIAEIDGAWWFIHSDRREMASNAILRIERAVHVIETEENLYEGVITFGGQQVHFHATFDEVEKKTAEWIQKTLMKNGVGSPTIVKQIQPHLVTIAKKFHDFQYVKRLARIGWHQDSRMFVFPNFSISKGEFDETVRAAVIESSDIPATRIYTPGPSSGDWDVTLDDTPAWAALWAGLAGFMANMIAPVIGNVYRPVGLIGGAGSIASMLGKHMAGELGMLSVGVSTAKLPLVLVQAATRRYGYPVWLDLYDKNRKAVHSLPTETDVNLMTSLHEGEAAALGVGTSWIFVRATKILTQRDSLPSLQGAMRYLAWLQAQDFKLPLATDLALSVLTSLREWAEQELGATKLDVFDSAQKLLKTPDATSVDRRFMHLVYWLQQAQKTREGQSEFFADFKQGAEPSGNYHLVLDPVDDRVYVSLAAIRRALVSSKLPLPNLDEAVATLATNAGDNGFIPGASGFVVAKSYWDTEKSKWQRGRL